jgi:hypothetical protein
MAYACATCLSSHLCLTISCVSQISTANGTDPSAFSRSTSWLYYFCSTDHSSCNATTPISAIATVTCGPCPTPAPTPTVYTPAPVNQPSPGPPHRHSSVAAIAGGTLGTLLGDYYGCGCMTLDSSSEVLIT